MSDALPATAEETPLEELFDEHYLRFWAPELEGERLRREVELIKRLGRLGPGGRALDVACGFGRVAIALAAAGVETTGIDLSPSLLAEAERRSASAGVRPRLVRGDMRDLDDVGEFECVLLWFTSFGYFDDGGNRRVLEEARRCLSPGGRLLIESRHWDRMQRSFEPTTVRSVGEDLLIERHRYEARSGVQHTHSTMLVAGERIVRRSRLRRYGAPELRALCLAAGFGAVEAFDEDGEALSPRSKRCVLVAER